jgi:DNA-binding NtrC family response regulator
MRDCDRHGAEDGVRPERDAHALTKLIGNAPVFSDALRQLQRVARSDATVLLVGETGTGKELAARAVHYMSSRAAFPFVAVNCAALPDTLFEAELFGHERGAFTDAYTARQGLLAQANKGTLLLDEIESLTPRGQGALLRVLHDRTFRALGSGAERRVDVRFIAATNVDLAPLVRLGGFRADLLYRLRVLWLQLPALRDRREDIPLLVQHFVVKQSPDHGRIATVSAAALDALVHYDWPGNVRELENTLIRAVHLAESGVIEPEHLGLASEDFAPAPMAADCIERGVSLQDSKRRVVHAFERAYLAQLMTRFRGNVTRAAEYARKERRELGKLLKRHGLSAKSYPEAT